MLDKLQVGVPSNQNKKKRKSSFKNMFGNEWFLSLTEKMHYLTM